MKGGENVSKEALVEGLLNHLCKKYDIDRSSFFLFTGEALPNLVSVDGKKALGFYIHLTRTMAIDVTSLETTERIRSTVFHEFRHLWQYKCFPEESEYWGTWTVKNRERMGEDSYLFSPLELDANRFAKSGGRLDDDSIMTAVSTSRYPYRELSQAQDLAARIAAESASLVRPEVLIYLVEHGFPVK